MKYSIVIPAYNAGKYIEECLNSVVGQNYSGPYEAVVVDDGSKDDTLSICKEYARRFDLITVIHQDNAGPFSARYAAYSAAKGEYVLHLDADDALRLDALSVIDKHISEFSVDMLLFNASSSPDFSNPLNLFPFKGQTVRFSGGEIDVLKELTCSSTCMSAMWSKVVKRSILKGVAYPEDMFPLVMGEDRLQSLFVVNEINSAMYVNEAVYYYRPNDTGSTNSFNPCYLGDAICIFKHESKLVSEWNNGSGSVVVSSGAPADNCLLAVYRYFQRSLDSSGFCTTVHRVRDAFHVVDEGFFDKLWMESCKGSNLRVDVRSFFRLALAGATRCAVAELCAQRKLAKCLRKIGRS